MRKLILSSLVIQDFILSLLFISFKGERRYYLKLIFKNRVGSLTTCSVFSLEFLNICQSDILEKKVKPI